MDENGEIVNKHEIVIIFCFRKYLSNVINFTFTFLYRGINTDYDNYYVHIY